MRPKSFSYRLTDPWTDRVVCGGRVEYDPHMAANGVYGRWLLRLKAHAKFFAAPILEDRTPRVHVTLHK